MAQAAEPFFDIDAVIAASSAAAHQAIKTAWEYRREGRMADYKRKVRDAWWYRNRRRQWELERNSETMQ